MKKFFLLTIVFTLAISWAAKGFAGNGEIERVTGWLFNLQSSGVFLADLEVQRKRLEMKYARIMAEKAIELDRQKRDLQIQKLNSQIELITGALKEMRGMQTRYRCQVKRILLTLRLLKKFRKQQAVQSLKIQNLVEVLRLEGELSDSTPENLEDLVKVCGRAFEVQKQTTAACEVVALFASSENAQLTEFSEKMMEDAFLKVLNHEGAANFSLDQLNSEISSLEAQLNLFTAYLNELEGKK